MPGRSRREFGSLYRRYDRRHSAFGGVPSLAFDSAIASAALYGLAPAPLGPGLISFPAGKPPGAVHAPGSAAWAGPITITPY